MMRTPLLRMTLVLSFVSLASLAAGCAGENPQTPGDALATGGADRGNASASPETSAGEASPAGSERPSVEGSDSASTASPAAESDAAGESASGEESSDEESSDEVSSDEVSRVEESNGEPAESEEEAPSSGSDSDETSADEAGGNDDSFQPRVSVDSDEPIKRSGDPETITYDDLKTEMPPDVEFEPKYLTDRIKELDGKTVLLPGFMQAGFQTRGISEFVMLKNTQCKFGPGGQAHHCVMVKLAPEQTTRYTTQVLKVEGVLLLKPWEGPDGNTWALFEMRDAVVK